MNYLCPKWHEVFRSDPGSRPSPPTSMSFIGPISGALVAGGVSSSVRLDQARCTYSASNHLSFTMAFQLWFTQGKQNGYFTYYKPFKDNHQNRGISKPVRASPHQLKQRTSKMTSNLQTTRYKCSPCGYPRRGYSPSFRALSHSQAAICQHNTGEMERADWGCLRLGWLCRKASRRLD